MGGHERQMNPGRRLEVGSFIIRNVLLGVGLAMDAFSVSLANGLNEPGMRRRKRVAIAGTFAGFQFLMPMAGWVCVTFIAELFKAFRPMIPWIAFILLIGIGLNMIISSIRHKEEEEKPATSVPMLLLQGVATSIDALSVGFTIAEYRALQATAASLIIGLVTFVICLAGVKLGHAAGMKLADKAGILGGAILIAIGIEILVKM